MDNQHRRIIGYRELGHDELDKINEIKAVGLRVDELIRSIETAAALSGGLEPDKRWLAIARTELQQGFMALVRSVARPQGF